MNQILKNKLNKGMEYLYIENYKRWLKKIEEAINNWKDIP